VTALTEASDEKRELRFRRQLARQDLVIFEEFGYIPFSNIGTELLFELCRFS
jgi:hypothetical protein